MENLNSELVNEDVVNEVETAEVVETVEIPDGVPEEFDVSQMNDLSDMDYEIPSSEVPESDEEDNSVADSFEDNDADEMLGKGPVKNEETAESVKSAPAKKRKTARKSTKAKTHDNLGEETDPTVKSIDQYVSPAEKEANDWYEISNLAKSKGIVWGRVSGVQKGFGNIKDGLFAVITLPKFSNMQVIIHEKDYWMETQNFGNSYAGMNEQEKEMRRMKTLSYQLGARIPFFIKHLARTTVKHDDYDTMQTPYRYLIVGDRVSAMHYIQDCWFFNDGKNMPKLNENDAYGANVLQVRPESVKVECCGVETYISAYELSGKKYVENCRDFCKCGDKIPVKILKCHVHKKGEPIYNGKNTAAKGTYPRNTVYFSVSGRLFDNGFVPKNLASMTKGGVYLGYVRSYNNASGVYSINLSNGVVGSVHASRVTGGNRLDIGDSVYFTMEEALATYVRGRCTKL